VRVKADERQRAQEDDADDKDDVKVKDVNMLEAQNVSGAELMQIRVENIKNNQEKGTPVYLKSLILFCTTDCALLSIHLSVFLCSPSSYEQKLRIHTHSVNLFLTSVCIISLRAKGKLT